MMDEAMRLAEASLAKGGAEFNECDLNKLARALLALRPLVEAADAYYDAEGNAAALAESRLLGTVCGLRGAR